MNQPDEILKYPLPYKDLVEFLLKKHDIHDGIWGVYASFNFAGVNTKDPSGQVLPAAVTGIKEIGISSFPEENSIAFDAAKLNPKIVSSKKLKRPSRKQA